VRKALLALVLCLLIFGFALSAKADLKVSLQPLQNHILEERPLTIYVVLENTGASPIAVYDQYRIPQNLEFEIENDHGDKIPQALLLPLGSEKLSETRLLKPGETLRFPIVNLNDYYQVAARNIYRIRATYRGAQIIQTDPVTVEVGNYRGELGYLIYSDTAYVKNQFDLTFVSVGDGTLRSFSNQFFLVGLNQKRIQLGASLFGGPGLGGKVQWLEEGVWWPAASIWGTYNDTKSLYFSSGYQLLTRYDHMEAVGLAFSKQLLQGMHLHLLSKFYDSSYSLADGTSKKQNISVYGAGFDTRVWVGTLTYEANVRSDNQALNDAVVFHFFPSWAPQLGIGYERQALNGDFAYQHLFITLRFFDFNSLFKL
jgi:hypothetical protein